MKKFCALYLIAVSCLAFPCRAASKAEESDNARMFAAHRVPMTFSSKPHPAMIGPKEREYRMSIRNGALYGDRFAGHYLLAGWGCGGGCTMLVAIDTETGTVIWFPGSIQHDGDGGNGMVFRADSNVLRVTGSLDGKDSADRWFVLEPAGFREIGNQPKKLVVAGR